MPNVNDMLSVDLLESIMDALLLDNDIAWFARARQNAKDTCQLWSFIISHSPRYWRKLYIGRPTKAEFILWQLGRAPHGPLQVQIYGCRGTDTVTEDIEEMASKLERCLVPVFPRVETLEMETTHIVDWITLAAVIGPCETYFLRSLTFTIGTANPMRIDWTQPTRRPTLPQTKWMNVQRLTGKGIIPVSGQWNAHANLTKLELTTFKSAGIGDVLAMLRGTKHLHELILDDVLFYTSIPSFDFQRARLTHLKRLRFKCWANLDWSVLGHIEAPSLDVLCLHVLGRSFAHVARTCTHLLGSVRQLDLLLWATDEEATNKIWGALDQVKTIDISQSGLDTWDSLHAYMDRNEHCWAGLEEIRLRRYLTKEEATSILRHHAARRDLRVVARVEGGSDEEKRWGGNGITVFTSLDDATNTTTRAHEYLWDEAQFR
ncbi:hypothetical protein R3P38DRAFT_3186862 [Favolaschia claudopus]|uniref:F-box domain-containing protein n=1 Tax=Favolaschia claudopus TaxID=2862362 RepID=A0AAW0C4N6_9AGAR